MTVFYDPYLKYKLKNYRFFVHLIRDVITHLRYKLKLTTYADQPLRFINCLSNIMSHILIIKINPLCCLVRIGPGFF